MGLLLLLLHDLRWNTLLCKELNTLLRKQLRHVRLAGIDAQVGKTVIDDIIDALVLIGEKGEGDGYGIGSSESYSVLEVAKMLKGEIEMLPERKGNRMTASVITSKTTALGWSAKRSVADYISEKIKEKPNFS